ASLITALSVPLSATILCTPVIVAISGQLSLVTIPVNIAVAPLIAPITISGFISALLVPFFPEIARLLMTAVQPLAALIVRIARTAATLPSLHISLALLGIIFILFLALVVKFVRSKLFTLSVLVFVTLVAALELPALIAFPTHDWHIFQCDVGQGDGLVYNASQHHAIVIDAGPDPELMDRCLKRLRINVVDLLILTHSHADHVNGLPGILRGRRVQSVWANFDPGISHQQVFQGNTYVSPHVKISVLWPQQNNFSGPQLSGDGSTENNKSITVLMRSPSVNPSQEVTLLATGDIEPPAQAEIAKYFSSKITIIKVPHHGSRFQDFSWLAKVKPDIALISVGAGNSYGQPSLTTITALTQLHTKVFRTDSDGAIEVGWSYDSAHLKIRIRREGHAWWKVRWV
ncbi:MAG: MBL fold metallo-hydrolase, partial [Actinobacteria bacterium]|nr:MBL fold metallo-hydrolase [Actinomycetota bacterium]